MAAENSKLQRKVPGRPFEKGVSGNPGGRPAGFTEFRALMQQKSPEAVTKLTEAVLEGKQWAVELLLAYAYGKPSQPIEGGEMFGIAIIAALEAARRRVKS